MARPSNTSRITPKGTRPQTTSPQAAQDMPAPSAGSPSAAWFGWLIAGLLSLGTVVIVGNYLSWYPGSPASAWIIVGLAIILVGILLATRWR